MDAGRDRRAFTPGDGEVGSRLRVVATFRDFDGVLESVTSPATAAVGNVNDAPTGVPVLDDRTPTEGAPVTVVTGSIADLDGLEGVTLQRQWQRGDGAAWQNIPAATGATFTPGAAEVGLRLRVVVTFTDNGGTAERVLSAETDVVAAAPAPPAPAAPAAPAGPAVAPEPPAPAAPLALERAVLPRTLAAPALVSEGLPVTLAAPAGTRVVRVRSSGRARTGRSRGCSSGPRRAARRYAAPPARHPGAAAGRQVPRRAHARHEPPQARRHDGEEDHHPSLTPPHPSGAMRPASCGPASDREPRPARPRAGRPRRA